MTASTEIAITEKEICTLIKRNFHRMIPEENNPELTGIILKTKKDFFVSF